MEKNMRYNMELFDMASDLIAIQRDIIYRTKKIEEYQIYDFDQTWGSTALGFGGVGGSAMTTARTYVLIPMDEEIAYVYFGGRFAYKCGINDNFREDIKNHNMASVRNVDRYGSYC